MADVQQQPYKYLTIFNAVKARIEDGTYPLGAKLPSETDLMGEFGASRPIVVRALELLRNDGWIEAEAGRGRFVRSNKPNDQRAVPPRTAGLLSDEVPGRVRVLEVAELIAPPRAMAALELTGQTTIVVRRRLVTVDGVGPIELGDAYIPLRLAEGTGVRSLNLLPEGLLRHLEQRKSMRFSQATERISARPATPHEAELLGVDPGDCLLTALVTVHDQGGAPAFALDIAVPPTRHEFEDSYPLP